MLAQPSFTTWNLSREKNLKNKKLKNPITNPLLTRPIWSSVAIDGMDYKQEIAFCYPGPFLEDSTSYPAFPLQFLEDSTVQIFQGLFLDDITSYSSFSRARFFQGFIEYIRPTSHLYVLF